MFYLCTKRVDSKLQGHEAILRFPPRLNFHREEVKAELRFRCLLLFCGREKQARYLQFLQCARRSRDDRLSVLAIFGQLRNLLPLPGTPQHLVAIRQAKQKSLKDNNLILSSTCICLIKAFSWSGVMIHQMESISR